ncbi:hypothetical protein, partial [Methanoregula sp.]|uniref:hypothetical protein n=1 Tax=Methanoregula sp. TaxID=2052170 RepID=UPI000CBBE190
MTFCDTLPEPAAPPAPSATPAAPARTPALPEGVPRPNSFYLSLPPTSNLRCRHRWISPEHAG